MLFCSVCLFKDVLFNPLYTGNPETGSLANSEDPDEMQHKAAFYQGLSCFLLLIQPTGREIHHNLDTSTL